MTHVTARHVRRPHRVTALGVIGELLLALGIGTALFVVWQLWISDALMAAELTGEADQLTAQWAEAEPSATPGDKDAEPATAPPVKMAQPADAEKFATLRIPRFGSDYNFLIAGGVSRARTLDPIGIGHYPTTAMPGEAGNFAVAAHRTAFGGAAFNRIGQLRVGDAVVVETKDGWYTYRFRNLEYVHPSSSDVLWPVPQFSEDPKDRYLTMTSCSPLWGSAERIIAFSTFESFTPRSEGQPRSLTDGASA